MEPCYQSMEGKPRKSRSLEQEPDLSHLGKERVFPCHSLTRSDWRLLLHAKHTVVHLYTHLEKKKFCLYASSLPSILYSLPALSSRNNRIDCTARIPRFRSTRPSSPPPPFLTILVVHTLSHTFHALFASVRSLFGNDSVLCGEAV